jgi:anti-anti-sigma regulatory factor
MFRSEIKKSGKQTDLTLIGDLTLENTDQLKSALIEALSKGKTLNIEFSEVTAVDFSSLQLLCSTHKTAELQNKLVTLHTDPPEIVTQTILDIGFDRHIGCIPRKSDRCLWLTGEKEEKKE